MRREEPRSFNGLSESRLKIEALAAGRNEVPIFKDSKGFGRNTFQ